MEQARYFTEVWDILRGERVDDAFWFTFAAYSFPHHPSSPQDDLDAASFGLVAVDGQAEARVAACPGGPRPHSGRFSGPSLRPPARNDPRPRPSAPSMRTSRGSGEEPLPWAAAKFLRAGQAQAWTEEWFNGHALYRLRDTVRYPKTA
jgi:hypothetical protein